MISLARAATRTTLQQHSRPFATSPIDYYAILELSPNATTEQVKSAYRKLAKKHHPDVSGGERAQERFRLIAEAYQVLSKVDYRVTYDLTKSTVSEVEKILNKKRDSKGLDVKPLDFAPHSEGYKRLQELAEERKLYNLDKFYRFKGGLPKLGTVTRGRSKGFTGERADVADLNFESRGGFSHISPSEETVDTYTANAYKLRQREDSYVHQRRRPYMPAEIDYTFSDFALVKGYLAFTGGILLLLSMKYLLEEPPKFVNRLKLKQLVEAGVTGLPEAGMRAISLR
jgi:curved DNA-binding protein CbpA